MSAPAKLVGGTFMARATTSTPLAAVPTPGTGWILTYRKSGRTRRFTSLKEAKPAHIEAAAEHGTRWVSLRPERGRRT